MRDNNSPFSEEWQDETVRRARFNNAIMLNELIYVMAYEERYSGILSDLWEVLGLNESKKIKFPYNPYKDGRLDRCGNLKFKEDRAGAWFYLWSRIAKTESGQFFFSKLSILAPIDLYYDVSCLKKVQQDKDRSEAHFIKLDELAAYLEKIKEIYGLLIPLPSKLFSKNNRFQGQLGMSPTEKKLRPVQRHKKECREVAKKIWKKDSTITIADMLMKDEITYACEGRIYAEKTIRDWIKDLCPNRSPGRRPKK